MAQDLQQLLLARNNASRAYTRMMRAPENDLEAVVADEFAKERYQIELRLYNAHQAWYNAAVAYRDAIHNDNNATDEAMQQARDYVNEIDVLPPPRDPDPVGGRRRRSSTPRKSSSSRRRRSTKRRTASRKQQKRRRGSRRAH